MRGNWLPKSPQKNTIPIAPPEGIMWFWVSLTVFFCTIAFYFTCYGLSSSYKTVKVYRVERATIGPHYGNSYYNKRLKVYTDKGIFECASSAVFNVPDREAIFRGIQAGNEYDVRVVGWTYGPFGWLQNIVSATKTRSLE